MIQRALLLAVCLATLAAAQPLGVLRVSVVLADGESGRAPVARHVLLVSDSPPSAPPRRIVTGPDGTVEVSLGAGTYAVESDRPVPFSGKAYAWVQLVDVVAGQTTVLELTAENAEVEEASFATPGVEAAGEPPPALALARWQPSVVALWTPTSLASGFVIDARGLVATSRRLVASASTVEVQLTPLLKVAGRLVVSDPASGVAIVRVDPSAVATVQPVPLPCGEGAGTPLEEGGEVYAIGGPLRWQQRLASGRVGRVESRAILTDLRLDPRSLGGPVFAADGRAVGLTSPEEENETTGRDDVRVVRLEEACDIVRDAEQLIEDSGPPSAERLPVEPTRPFPPDALRDAAQRRAGASPYQLSSSDFDVAFITPPLVYAARQRWGPSGPGQGGPDPGALDAGQERMRLLTDFGPWSDYVADALPVLLVRATPRLVEGFWKKVARGAAYTQGVSLPPLRSFKPGFSRLRAFCGDAEVTPIHALVIERQISDREAIREGLLVFDPAALGPPCGRVKLVLFSEKRPDQGDSREVDGALLEQVWSDFSPYREQGGQVGPMARNHLP